MKKMTSNEIRNTWLNFFKSKGHHIEPGSSLIPKNDPTLLWINAGVAALKQYFDGREIPPSKRITNLQRSIRTNDIEHVGHTARHHTFFEMMGNFSIGDYFRKEAIAWAFELLTGEDYFAFPKDKLYMTYFPDDMDTKNCWLSHGVSEDHLIPVSDNFWEIGEGPCGPDTEIFFDRGEKYDPNGIGIRLLREDIENDRYIEIWNIVLSQFNSETGKKRSEYKELPSKNIDTGAGLERFACIMQGTDTNFETDLFMPMIKEVEKISSSKYDDNHLAYRVIVDHIRAITFALADGEMFSNEGRGYVLRRLLRRAERYGRVLGINKPFLSGLVDVVVNTMNDFYPYLNEHKTFIKKMVEAEENKFLKTLTNGETLLNKLIADGKDLSGEDMFRLYDTFGFPKELTMEMCEEKGVKYDLPSFEEQMKAQKERAREARGNLQSMNKQSIDLMNFKTSSTFNYGKAPVEATIIGLFKDGVKVDSIDTEGDVMLDLTNFYAESGGQVSDTGIIKNENVSAKVVKVIKAPNKQHLHHVEIMFGEFNVGDKVTAKIDVTRRNKIMRNHSSVHLLQRALTDILGDHIVQHGSFVNDEYSHFDFNHFQKMSPEEIAEVERKVNAWIFESIPSETKILPIEEAKKLGARALFDDKYGDVVRVVCFGDISKEFCGGTHVENTADIGLFTIEYEESVAAGIRRIQARTSEGAYLLFKQKEAILSSIKDEFGLLSNTEIMPRIKANSIEREELKKNVATLNSKVASYAANDLFNSFEVIKDLDVLVKFLPDASRSDLLSLGEKLKSKKENYLLVLVGQEGSTYPIVTLCSDKAVKSGLRAGDLVRNVANILGGSGGGRPEMASGAGKNIDNIESALLKAKEIING